MSTNLSQEMKNILTNYSDELLEKIEKAVYEVGEDTAERFKTLGGFDDRTGKYRRSWKVTQEKRRTFTKTTVHATGSQARLTHLLEFGHAKANGGRTRAFPHIETNNERAEEEAIKRITKVIEEMR